LISTDPGFHGLLSGMASVLLTVLETRNVISGLEGVFKKVSMTYIPMIPRHLLASCPPKSIFGRPQHIDNRLV
jgi:hypothetical protein